MSMTNVVARSCIKHGLTLFDTDRAVDPTEHATNGASAAVRQEILRLAAASLPDGPCNPDAEVVFSAMR